MSGRLEEYQKREKELEQFIEKYGDLSITGGAFHDGIKKTLEDVNRCKRALIELSFAIEHEESLTDNPKLKNFVQSKTTEDIVHGFDDLYGKYGHIKEKDIKEKYIKEKDLNEEDKRKWNTSIFMDDKGVPIRDGMDGLVDCLFDHLDENAKAAKIRTLKSLDISSPSTWERINEEIYQGVDTISRHMEVPKGKPDDIRDQANGKDQGINAKIQVNDSVRALATELKKQNSHLTDSDIQKFNELVQEYSKASVSGLIAGTMQGPQYDAKTGKLMINGKDAAESLTMYEMGQAHVAVCMGMAVNNRRDAAYLNLQQWLSNKGIMTDNIIVNYGGTDTSFNDMIGNVAAGHYAAYVQVNHGLAGHLDRDKMEQTLPTRVEENDASLWQIWQGNWKNNSASKGQGEYQKRLYETKQAQEKEMEKASFKDPEKAPIRALFDLYKRVYVIMKKLTSTFESLGYLEKAMPQMKKWNIKWIESEKPEREIVPQFKGVAIDYLYADLMEGVADHERRERIQQYKNGLASIDSKIPHSEEVGHEGEIAKHIDVSVASHLNEEKGNMEKQLFMSEDDMRADYDTKFDRTVKGIRRLHQSGAGRKDVAGKFEQAFGNKEDYQRFLGLIDSYSAVQTPIQKKTIMQSLEPMLGRYGGYAMDARREKLSEIAKREKLAQQEPPSHTNVL